MERYAKREKRKERREEDRGMRGRGWSAASPLLVALASPEGMPPRPTSPAGCATSSGDDANPSVPLIAGFLAAYWGLMGALEPS